MRPGWFNVFFTGLTGWSLILGLIFYIQCSLFFIQKYIFLGVFFLWILHGLCIFYLVILTMYWSLIPGSTSIVRIRFVFIEEHKSRTFFSLAGSVTTCSMLSSLNTSIIFWFIFVSCFGDDKIVPFASWYSEDWSLLLIWYCCCCRSHWVIPQDFLFLLGCLFGFCRII